MIVLWGARRGDVTYNSRDYWRSRIPTGAMTLVGHNAMFDVGMVLSASSSGVELFRIVGMEPGRIGVEYVTS